VRKNISKSIFSYLLLFILLFSPGHARGFEKPGAANEENRIKLLSGLIRNHLETNHFARKKIDDGVSEAAFGLYIKQLDGQKSFLLKKNFKELRKYSRSIDDQVNSGKLDLPLKAAAVFSERIPVVQNIVKEILSGPFDFSVKEFIETDAEKNDFCETDSELKERWRKLLKYQALQQFMEQSEKIPSESARSDLPADATQLADSVRDKLLNTYNVFFSRLAAKNQAEYNEEFFNAFTHSFDPHTEYMPPMNKEDFDIRMSGSLEGIGATLKEDENYIKVVSVMAGGPASKQGQLQAEDIILKVGEGKGEPVDIIGMKVKDAVRLIRGKKGTEVRLTIRKPDSKTLNIALVRDVIQIEDAFVKSTTIENGTGDTFGYVKVPSFYRDFGKAGGGNEGRNSTDDLKAELKKLKDTNINGLIIDLRNNGGGALTDAVRMAGLFIRTGPVVQVKNSGGKSQTLGDDDPDIMYTGPVVVLVNSISASASEILAGALQDYNRAVIIGGEHTHGKGTVQTIVDFDSELRIFQPNYKPVGALKLTTQKFYRISGESTQYRGVKPDLVLPDVLSGLRTGEQYLDYALPWDSIGPVPFKKWEGCGPDISQLKGKSLTRIKSNNSFIDMEIEAGRFAEKQKNTLKSLNIQDMRREFAESQTMKEKSSEAAMGHAPAKKDAKTPEERKAAFFLEVSADAYVREAISVIGDMISSDPSCSQVAAN
jgi:carboxyl-terminal processing protease